MRMYGGLNDSEYFQSTRPGLEDWAEGRYDPNELYANLCLSVLKVYADTASELGLSFPYSIPEGADIYQSLLNIVSNAGITLKEWRVEKQFEEVYDVLTSRILPRWAKSVDAQDVVTSNLVLSRLRKNQETLQNAQRVNAIILSVYTGLIGVMAKLSPPPFGKGLSLYASWFSAMATKSIADQLAAVRKEIPKVEQQHTAIKASRIVRIQDREKEEQEKEKAKEQEEKKSRLFSVVAYASGGLFGAILLYALTQRKMR